MTGGRPTTARRLRCADDESGSATVLAVGVLAAVLSVTVAALAVLGVVRAVHVARSAADLAALAAAGLIQQQVPPAAACARARDLARRQGARVTACVVDGSAVTVTTAVSIPLRLAGVVPETAEGQARAGPAPP